mgnify:CR=1 FL=1
MIIETASLGANKMKTAFCVVAICLTAACGGAGGSMGPSIASQNYPDLVAMSLESVTLSPDRSFAGMLNSVRSVNGAGAVTYDDRLGVAAQRHADDMLANPTLKHVGSDNSKFFERARDAGYMYSAIGENIARGYLSEESVLRGWVNSPGHQENNVNTAFEDFALAKAGSGGSQTWVLMLGRE